jgi:hypothetical protein
VQLLRGLAGRDSQLFSEPDAQILVDTEGGGRVSGRGQGLHQQPMTRLAKGLLLDEPPRDTLRRGKLRAAELRGRARATPAVTDAPPRSRVLLPRRGTPAPRRRARPATVPRPPPTRPGRSPTPRGGSRGPPPPRPPMRAPRERDAPPSALRSGRSGGASRAARAERRRARRACPRARGCRPARRGTRSAAGSRRDTRRATGLAAREAHARCGGLRSWRRTRRRAGSVSPPTLRQHSPNRRPVQRGRPERGGAR